MHYIPNILTIFRILASLLILFIPNNLFFPFYFFAGATDIIDGWLARKMHWTSDFGTFLDSIADLAFFVAVVLKILFTIKLPAFLLWGALIIIFIRGITYLIGYYRFRKFASLHTYLNKLTGLLLFLSPVLLLFLPIKPFGIVLLFCGSLSAAEEFLIVLTTRTLDKNRTTFFNKK